MRPIAVATCDLDSLIVTGTSPFQPPFPLGHECVAEVIEAGDAVTSVAAGRLVSVPFQISCGSCDACLAGRTSNCSRVPFMSTYGFGPAVERWGGFLSDLVEVPFAEHMLVPVPEGLEPSAVASASDNLSDAWRAVGPALAEYPAPTCWSSAAPAPARSACTQPEWPSRSALDRCCTWTATSPGGRSPRGSAPRRWRRNRNGWAPTRSPWTRARTRRV